MLQSQATEPHTFADLVIVELKEIYRSMDPTVLAQLDIIAVNLENWKQRSRSAWTSRKG